jgi:hypothetical protein
MLHSQAVQWNNTNNAVVLLTVAPTGTLTTDINSWVAAFDRNLPDISVAQIQGRFLPRVTTKRDKSLSDF